MNDEYGKRKMEEGFIQKQVAASLHVFSKSHNKPLQRSFSSSLRYTVLHHIPFLTFFADSLVACKHAMKIICS
jgi:hypothetical protein